MDRPFRACIFDMDGLLLNTEDLITDCINAILEKYGRPTLPWSLKARIQGRTAKESNAILLEWAQLPITPDEYLSQLKLLHGQVFPTAEPLPGVLELLERLQSRNEVALALATSSSKEKFELKIRGWASLFECFTDDCRVLGDDVRVQNHKPAPDIYLCALQCLNKDAKARQITAAQCLVFEDSVQGVAAARHAGMAVVWCPHPALLRELLEGADEDVRANFYSLLGLDSVPIHHMDSQALAGLIDRSTGGCITLLLTLKDFPHDYFDI